MTPSLQQRLPPATPALRALVLMNVAVFVLWQVSASDPQWLAFMDRQFTVSVDGMQHGRLWTLLTSAISQYSALHLAFNLIALASFGADVERIIGSRGFVHLYVAGALTSSAAHLLWSVFSGSWIPALGASGAVMAVATVSALLYPNRYLLLFFIIPLPVRAGLLLFIVIDMFGMFSPSGDSIAHAAHLGGAAYGLLFWYSGATAYVRERLEELGLAHRVRPPRWPTSRAD